MPGIGNSQTATFEMTITPVVCKCVLPPQVFLSGRIFDRVVARAEPYWFAYLAFYGDQVSWLRFEIVDTRDGRILWRNGQLLKGVHSGTIDGT